MEKFSEEQLRELAAQLRHPKGENGIATAKSMNVTNDNMIRQTIAVIDFNDNTNILEIGPGNGLHIPYLFEKNHAIHYTGIDISELMIDESNRLNTKWTQSGKAIFELTDGELIDKKGNTFDVIFTVNTLYFWKNPTTYLAEIFRVLKKDGQFIIAFIPKSNMEKIPFAKYGFELYDTEKVNSLLQQIGFSVQTNTSFEEQIQSNIGTQIIRTFTIIKAVKP